jgi:hypothetical protein
MSWKSVLCPAGNDLRVAKWNGWKDDFLVGYWLSLRSGRLAGSGDTRPFSATYKRLLSGMNLSVFVAFTIRRPSMDTRRSLQTDTLPLLCGSSKVI